LDLLDYPALGVRKLRKLTGLNSEEADRRRVLRSRDFLSGRFAAAGMDGNLGVS